MKDTKKSIDNNNNIINTNIKDVELVCICVNLNYTVRIDITYDPPYINHQ